MNFQPFHHTVVATDVVGSSIRHDQLQLKMRTDLLDLLGRALRRQGLNIDGLTPADLGDGFRLHAPSSVSPLSMVSPFLHNLATELRVHRQSANERSRLRLRLAIHMGLLNREDSGGLSGVTLSECARLLDAPAARELIADAPDADLVVVVSDAVFEAVVRQGYGPAPEDFQRIPVVVKETSTHAWAYLAGRPDTGRPIGAQPGDRHTADGGPDRTDTGGPPAGVVLNSARAWIHNGGRSWADAGSRATDHDE
ncbi:hypothetical protein [Micromonospora sp. WMMD736]|uniref:hypothetical protein n=1 Tax=Micromonospora sp. WMMD736 TaxID=3404112 RepID=UPI003B9474DD